MDLETIIKSASPDVVVFLLTTLIAFLSWIIKSLVEKPISESKNTFNKFLDKRIEILTEVKTRLNFIAYFPSGRDSLKYKNQLQDIILKDGKTGYLNKETFDAILKISIDSITDENLLLKTIKEINDDLYIQVSKIQDEINFYRKFSNYNPLRRFTGLALLVLQYIISIVLVISVIYIMISTFIDSSVLWKVCIFVISLIILYFIDKWLKK